MFGLGALAFGAFGANANGWPTSSVVGGIVGGAVGLLVVVVSLISLKKLTKKVDAFAVQRHLLLSFGLKLVAAVVLAVVAQFVEGESGPWLDLEATLMAFMGLVFFGFALQGSLLEAPSDSVGSDKRQPPDSQTGQSK